MHPKTLRPLVEADIALHIRSIDAPDAPGTRIIPEAQLVATGMA
jgi:aspartokinase